MHQNVMVPENILMFTPQEAKNVFLTVGARQNLSRSKTYGMKLISEGYEVLKAFAKNGIIVERFYATSRTPDGVRLCRDMGFQVKEDNHASAVKRFYLDIKITTSPLFRECQKIIRKQKQQNRN